MSIHIDNLARVIRDSVSDADATREEWESALDLAFGPRVAAELDGDVIDTGKRDGLEIVWRDTATNEEWVDGSTDVWDATNGRSVAPGWSVQA